MGACLIGLDQNIRLFEYSFGGLAFDFQFWDSNILFFFFYGSHSRLNMNRPWVNVMNVMIQFIWKRRQQCRRPQLCGSTLNWVRTRQRQCAKYAIWNWPTTTAHQVWKITRVLQVVRLVAYIVGVKKQAAFIRMLISNFTHDKNVHLICLENTCAYGSHKNVILFKLFVN